MPWDDINKKAVANEAEREHGLDSINTMSVWKSINPEHVESLIAKAVLLGASFRSFGDVVTCEYPKMDGRGTGGTGGYRTQGDAAIAALYIMGYIIDRKTGDVRPSLNLLEIQEKRDGQP